MKQAASTPVDVFARKVHEFARRISHDEGLRHEKLRSQRMVKRWIDHKGMCSTQISLDPEADARLSAADSTPPRSPPGRTNPDDGRTFDQIHANTFMAMVQRSPVPGSRRPIELLVLIDLETLHSGLHDASVCETYDGQPLHQRRCDGWPARPTSSRSCSPAKAESSTSDEPNAWRQPINAEHSEPCTKPAPHPTAPSASATATSTTSTNGRKEADRPGQPDPLCSKHHHLIHEGRWPPPARAPAA